MLLLWRCDWVWVAHIVRFTQTDNNKYLACFVARQTVPIPTKWQGQTVSECNWVCGICSARTSARPARTGGKPNWKFTSSRRTVRKSLGDGLQNQRNFSDLAESANCIVCYTMQMRFSVSHTHIGILDGCAMHEMWLFSKMQLFDLNCIV